jgi:GNAT superfamily N-acetyltransferase
MLLKLTHFGQIYRYPAAGTLERERMLRFAIDFRLPDFKRILCSQIFHAFVVRNEGTGEAVAISNWKVVALEAKQTTTVTTTPILFRNQTIMEKVRSWSYWLYDKAIKVVPFWLYKLFNPKKAPIYERKARWFAKVTKNFEASVLPLDKQTGYWVLMHLGVLPEFGGRGLASSLLQWGLDRADVEDRPIYIIATMAGARLYAKRGFEALSTDIYFPGEPSGGFEVLMMRRKRVSERKV